MSRESTLDQRQKALRRADKVRLARAQTKRDIKAGRRTVSEAITDPCCATATVWTLFKAQRGWGEKVTPVFFHRLNAKYDIAIGASRKCKDLTRREHMALKAALSEGKPETQDAA